VVKRGLLEGVWGVVEGLVKVWWVCVCVFCFLFV
jgi:hypothetical protein